MNFYECCDLMNKVYYNKYIVYKRKVMPRDFHRFTWNIKNFNCDGKKIAHSKSNFRDFFVVLQLYSAAKLM